MWGDWKEDACKECSLSSLQQRTAPSEKGWRRWWESQGTCTNCWKCSSRGCPCPWSFGWDGGCRLKNVWTHCQVWLPLMVSDFAIWFFAFLIWNSFITGLASWNHFIRSCVILWFVSDLGAIHCKRITVLAGLALYFLAAQVRINILRAVFEENAPHCCLEHLGPLWLDLCNHATSICRHTEGTWLANAINYNRCTFYLEEPCDRKVAGKGVNWQNICLRNRFEISKAMCFSFCACQRDETCDPCDIVITSVRMCVWLSRMFLLGLLSYMKSFHYFFRIVKTQSKHKMDLEWILSLFCQLWLCVSLGIAKVHPILRSSAIQRHGWSSFVHWWLERGYHPWGPVWYQASTSLVALLMKF